MSEPARKPDVREQYGVAVNSSMLTIEERSERALDRVAAMGAAAAHVAAGADLAKLPIAAMGLEVYQRSADMRDLMLNPGMPDARDVIAGELGPVLWHIRYGGQHELVREGIVLFARWLRRIFEGFDTDAHLAVLERFAARVLHEWLSDKCIACGGSGKLERTKSGAWIRPRGSMQRNATFRACTGCMGNGLARPSHGDRARWLDIPLAWYESERWAQRFNQAMTLLRHMHVDRIHRPLTRQLERGTKRD